MIGQKQPNIEQPQCKVSKASCSFLTHINGGSPYEKSVNAAIHTGHMCAWVGEVGKHSKATLPYLKQECEESPCTHHELPVPHLVYNCGRS